MGKRPRQEIYTQAIKLAMQGMPSREISNRLGVSNNVVKYALQQLASKEESDAIREARSLVTVNQLDLSHPTFKGGEQPRAYSPSLSATLGLSSESEPQDEVESESLYTLLTQFITTRTLELEALLSRVSKMQQEISAAESAVRIFLMTEEEKNNHSEEEQDDEE